MTQVDDEVWDQLEASTPGLALETREEIQIDGQAAVERVFSFPADSGEARITVLQGHVVDGLSLYQFSAWTPSAEASEQYRAEIEEISVRPDFSP